MIKDIIQSSDFSFDELKEKSYIKTYPTERQKISFVVPVRGRAEFLPILWDAFCKARDHAQMTDQISMTVVEHTDRPVHIKFCKDNKINYIRIKSQPEELFNKCAAMNCGALWSIDSEYLLFHDLDCIMKQDFFVNILRNLHTKESRAVQTFTGRRVLYCQEEITNNILQGGFDYETLNLDNVNVRLPMFIGAPGGSICLERTLFNEVGGYDHLLFQANSPEDIFFWQKVDAVAKMDICDAPANELFHLNHPVTYYSNPRINEMKGYHQEFESMDLKAKIDFITLCKDKFSQWTHTTI